MPSKITLSKEEKKTIATGVLKQLQEMLNGNFEGTETLSLKIPKMEAIKCETKPKIIISTTAGLKMSELVRNCDGEVGWHGFVERPDEGTFIIKDIVVYPQTVTATTVDTDETEYAIWLSQISTPDLKTMRFQAHSHVNMSCTPSGRDTDLFNKYLTSLKQDDYYIFFICNKRGEINAFLYDLKTNTKYVKEDLEIIRETDMSEWFASIKDNIKSYSRQTTVTHHPKTYNEYGSAHNYGAFDTYYEDMVQRGYAKTTQPAEDKFNSGWEDKVKDYYAKKDTKKTTKKTDKKKK